MVHFELLEFCRIKYGVCARVYVCACVCVSVCVFVSVNKNPATNALTANWMVAYITDSDPIETYVASKVKVMVT